jgi:acyl-coenzyme A thioesterase PaaI-like protein
MAVAKMSAAEVERFLQQEFPQAFKGGDITIESADGTKCLLRQRYSEKMLRPGGTVSGPTLMALADFAMYVVLLSQGATGAGRAGGGAAVEARQTPGRGRGQPAVGGVARSDRPRHVDLFHSESIGFLEVLLHLISKLLFLLY